MEFSGNHLSSTSHFRKKDGHDGEVLGCWDPGLQDTHASDLSHLDVWWNSLVEFAHFLTPMHESWV